MGKRKKNQRIKAEIGKKNKNKVCLSVCKSGWRRCRCTNWRVHVRKGLHPAYKCGLYTHVYYVSSCYTFLLQKWKELLVTWPLRPQSFVLAGWWSVYKTQLHGIWTDKAWCLVQGWSSFCILHCNIVAAAYILLLKSRKPNQFAH